MKNRKAFTLIELMVALMIFSFMIMSMVSVYITAEKHMFQNYRYDRMRTSLTTAAKFMKTSFASATRIDTPAVGASGNILAYASNIDQNGCYPIAAGEQARWHYFCMTACNAALGFQPGAQCFFYHTQPVAGGGGCPNGAAWNSAASYPVTCGIQTRGASESVTLLMPYVSAPSNAPNFLFSRSAALSIERNNVRAAIRVLWNPPVGLQNVSRAVDTTMETYLSANIVAQ